MTVAITKAEFQERLRRQRQHAKAAAAAFGDAAAKGDLGRLSAAISAVEAAGAWTAAFRVAGKIETVPDHFRQAFANSWVVHGDGFRSDVRNDRVLKLGLRRLLPRYTGPAIELYRGDSAFNRRRRSYGQSWSSDVEVARSFALGVWRTFDGGSVLLRCHAPPVAIIYAFEGDDDHYGEREFVVDWRLAGRITVVERFSQVDP